MIKEETIVKMADRLEYFTKLARIGKHCMDKRMLNDTESLIYDVRNDYDKRRYAFDGLVPKEELDELSAENDRLHDRILDLEQELDENT